MSDDLGTGYLDGLLAGVGIGNGIVDDYDSAALDALIAEVEQQERSLPNLPDEFWRARPALEQIRQAAWQRSRAPDAVLAGVLGRVAVLIPPTLTLPPIVGAPATFDFLPAIVGPPGAGKSTAVAVARQLVPIDRDDIVDGLPLGSGEGLIDAYLGPPEEVPGSKRRTRPQVHSAVLAIVDEAQVLTELGGRRGSTLLPTIRSAFMGATLGQANADAGRNRRLTEGRYRFVGIFSWQPEHAAVILGDVAAGTPQRLVWFAGTDPNIPDEPCDWPGPLRWDPPPTIAGGSEFDVDTTIANEIRARNRARARGLEVDADPLDAHADLCRLKIAGLLAVLANRTAVDPADWKLAATIMRASRTVRAGIIAHQRQQARAREFANNERAARREEHIETDRERRAFEAATRAIARRAHRDGPGSIVTRRDLERAIASKHRELVDTDAVIANAIERDWIEPHPDGFKPAESRPA